MIESTINSYFNSAAESMSMMKSQAQSISSAVNFLRNALDQGSKVLICGNGGSASDAQHFAAELVGRFERERSPMAAISLNTDTSILTAIANDYGYESIFSKQIEALGRPNDVLIAISTSGNSPSVLRAVATAKEKGLKTIALTSTKGMLREQVDLPIESSSLRTCHIQENHIATLQLIAFLLED